MCGCMQSSSSSCSGKHVTLTNKSTEACTGLNQDNPGFLFQWLWMCDCGIIAAEKTQLVTKKKVSRSDWQVVIVHLESCNIFYEKKAGKECKSVTGEGWRGARIGHTKNTFFCENSHLGLQSYTDTSQEEWCRAGEEREKEGGKTFSEAESQTFSLVATSYGYKQSNN